MIFRIGLENNNEGIRSIAWALELPGCFACGADGDSALDGPFRRTARLPEAWIAKHESTPWLNIDTIELHVEDTWTDYNINAAFDRDEKATTTWWTPGSSMTGSRLLRRISSAA